jgi:acyl CoA:acetate/3-ketoacid CoA transferase alpha subunit/acyl CoA:acetate/3-ketoacid CoA transferase beta subunit
MNTSNPKGSTNELNPALKSKVVPLEEAIRRHIKPGMTLHLAGGLGGPGAATCEIIRQFYGKKPEFALIQSTVTGHSLNLLQCNLLRKLIFTACVDISTSSRPSKIMQKIWAEKSIEVENWSLCSLQQRLMAGALGVHFLPTRSVSRSSLAKDNRMSFQEIDSPFEDGKRIGIVKALNPDVSVVHGCVADSQGNTIMPIPYGDDLWGSPASRNGVLVTVEKIVSPDFISRHAAMVKIPSYMVIAVSEAPLGLHPFSLAGPGISECESYETDRDFLVDLHKASREREQLDNWIKEWVLDCQTHTDYLNKLGKKRIAFLKQVDGNNAHKEKPESNITAMSENQVGYSQEELLIIVAAREIIQSIVESGHKIILLGAGSRAISGVMAYFQLRAQGYELEPITGNGQFGYEPQVGEIASQTISSICSSKMVTDTITTHGIFVGGENSKCLSVLGAGQIDKYGNINSTLASDGQFLVGSGGANDSVNAREVIVILNQAKDRFQDSLSYVTGSGDRIKKVISTMGVFKKPSDSRELHLTAYFPDPHLSDRKEHIKQIQDNCGWPLKLTDDIHEVQKPTPEEIKLLRRFLPAHI